MALTAKQTEALAAISAGKWFHVTDGRTVRSLEGRGLIAVEREGRTRMTRRGQSFATEIVGMVAV